MEVAVNNSPQEIEPRAWLNAHKEATGLSWAQLGNLADVNASTLSLFATGKYQGRNDVVAEKIAGYRGRLDAQALIAADVPTVPEWYETATSASMLRLLRWAQSGKIVLIVTTPGIGKTKVAQRFAASGPNVWLATMAPSTAGVATMLTEVAAAIGLGEVKGSPQQLSRRIKAHVRDRKGLLIVDEAQELTDKALNELRHLHDVMGLGIALMGNESVVGQIDGRKSALAQVSSRFSFKHVQTAPIAGDLDALFLAWGIEDEAQRTFLARIGALPGALREVTHTIEIALMAAFGEGQALSLDHLRAAAKQRHVKVGAL